MYFSIHGNNACFLLAFTAQVADAEGQLTSAQDKGEALAEEGSSADHNAILGDLGNLKSQLASLRKSIQNLKTQEQGLLAEQERQLQALEKTLQDLRADEAQARSRPALTMQPESIDAELESHKVRTQPCSASLKMHLFGCFQAFESPLAVLCTFG